MNIDFTTHAGYLEVPEMGMEMNGKRADRLGAKGLVSTRRVSKDVNRPVGRGKSRERRGKNGRDVLPRGETKVP